MLRDWDKRAIWTDRDDVLAPCRMSCRLTFVTLTCSISKSHSRFEVVDGGGWRSIVKGAAAAAGWQPEEDDTALEALRRCYQ